MGCLALGKGGGGLKGVSVGQNGVLGVKTGAGVKNGCHGCEWV